MHVDFVLEVCLVIMDVLMGFTQQLRASLPLSYLCIILRPDVANVLCHM